MNLFNFSESSLAKRTNNANNTTHYVKLGKKDERVPNATTTLFLQE